MLWFLIILIAVAVGVCVAVEMVRQHSMRIIKERSCAGFSWHRRFPDARTDEIRRFLDLFVDAFAFPKRYRLRLQPDDQVMDLYRILNPPNWTISDVLECETLSIDLEREYGLNLNTCWRDDITLADLFQRVRA